MRAGPRTNQTDNIYDSPLTPQQTASPYSSNTRCIHPDEPRMIYPYQKATHSYNNIRIVSPEQSSHSVEDMQTPRSHDFSQALHEHQKAISPHQNDVLSGRGSGITSHPGNEFLRYLVANAKAKYLLKSSKGEKTRIGQSIVDHIRSRHPPGRFLARCEDDEPGSPGARGLWYDIGDQRARQKVNQCLREGAKEIKAAAQKKKDGSFSDDDQDELELRCKRSSSSEMTAISDNRKADRIKGKPSTPRGIGIGDDMTSSFPPRKKMQMHVRHNSSGVIPVSIQQYGGGISRDQMFGYENNPPFPSGKVIPDQRQRRFEPQASPYFCSPPVINRVMQNQNQSAFFQRSHSDPSHESWRNFDTKLYQQPISMPSLSRDERDRSDVFRSLDISNRNTHKTMAPNDFHVKSSQEDVIHYPGRKVRTDQTVSLTDPHFFSAKTPVQRNNNSFLYDSRASEANGENIFTRDAINERETVWRKCEASHTNWVEVHGDEYSQTDQKNEITHHPAAERIVWIDREAPSPELHLLSDKTPIQSNTSSYLFESPAYEAKAEETLTPTEQEIIGRRSEASSTHEVQRGEFSNIEQNTSDNSIDLSFDSEMLFAVGAVDYSASTLTQKGPDIACRNDYEELDSSHNHSFTSTNIFSEGHQNESFSGEFLQDDFTKSLKQDRCPITMHEDGPESLTRKSSSSSCFSMKSVSESIMTNFSIFSEQLFGNGEISWSAGLTDSFCANAQENSM